MANKQIFKIATIDKKWFAILHLNWANADHCPICGTKWVYGDCSQVYSELPIDRGKVRLDGFEWIVIPLSCEHGFNLCKSGIGMKNVGGFILKRNTV